MELLQIRNASITINTILYILYIKELRSVICLLFTQDYLYT